MNTPVETPAVELAAIATPAEAPLAPFVDPRESASSLMLNDHHMARMVEFSKIMASGRCTVPDALRNPGDCLAITMQSLQWGMNPFAVAQKCHLVHGTLGYEAQLVNAVITTMSPTKDRLHYEWFGEWSLILGKFKKVQSQKAGGSDYTVPDWNQKDEAGLGVRVWATLRGEDEPRVLELLLAQAVVRNSTLWAQDPRQQLAYLATKRWARLYCPDVILGVYTPDELQTLPEKEINPLRRTGAQAAEAVRQTGATIDPQQEAERKTLIAKLEETAKIAGTTAYETAWKELTKEQRKLVGLDEHARLKALAAQPADGFEGATHG